MPNDYESKPHDGQHSVRQPGNDWRSGSGIGGMAQRLVSYGNWAGPGNRMETENADYIARKKQEDPSYDEYRDPVLMNNPRYQAIDGMDAAAQRHDGGYSQHRDNQNMFGWQGMRNVREDDRRLVADTQAEMDANGSQYSSGAQAYSRGLRGFFGSRVMGMDAMDWTGGKAQEAGHGLTNFAQGARDWRSLGDAGHGLAQGAQSAGSWLANSGREAWQGAQQAGHQLSGLGVVGGLGAAAGFGNVAVAGAGHLAGQAWNGASHLAGQALHGAQDAGTRAVDGATHLAGQAWSGAQAVGTRAMDDASHLAHSAGTMLSNGASTVSSSAQRAGAAARNGASRLYNWMTH